MLKEEETERLGNTKKLIVKPIIYKLLSLCKSMVHNLQQSLTSIWGRAGVGFAYFSFSFENARVSAFSLKKWAVKEATEPYAMV